MALDEPQEDDKVFEESGITYAINKDLYEQVKPINVDYVQPQGICYKITSNLAPNSCAPAAAKRVRRVPSCGNPRTADPSAKPL